MNALRRRGICPGLSAPMPTGDGLLVRLMPAAPIPLDALIGFCEAARRHGNGTIEVSARGSLQVRGLTPRSAPLFASAVAELGIAAHDGAAVLPSPLWGGVGGGGRAEGHRWATRHHPPPQPSPTRGEGVREAWVKSSGDDSSRSKNTQVNTADVATELRRAIANARPGLSPKISIVVDEGRQLHLDGLSADIRLRATASVHEPGFWVGLGGDGASATWFGTVAANDVVSTVLGILTIIAAYGPAARAIEILRADGVEAFRSVSSLIKPSSAPPQRTPAEMIGLHSMCDSRVAVGIGLAFGHTQADALAELARVAAICGARAVWPAPDRALLLIGVSASDAFDLTATAEQLGFVIHVDDPRRRIAACPGAPACGSGLIPARALALALAPVLEPILKTGPKGVAVHISGCLKGCAHPAPAALTLVGTPRGCGIIQDGTARAMPDRCVDPANLSAEISRISTKTKEAARG
jgi:precorrin-3B synthase